MTTPSRNFYIIEFNNGVMVVPYKWMSHNKTSCVFPPVIKNEKIMYKLVNDMFEPKDNWCAHSVKKIIGSFDTFLKAREILNDVTQYNLSEVGTDFEETNKSTRKFRAAKNDLSDEENESISINDQFDKFPSPPPTSPNMFHSPKKNGEFDDKIDFFDDSTGFGTNKHVKTTKNIDIFGSDDNSTELSEQVMENSNHLTVMVYSPSKKYTKIEKEKKSHSCFPNSNNKKKKVEEIRLKQRTPIKKKRNYNSQKMYSSNCEMININKKQSVYCQNNLNSDVDVNKFDGPNPKRIHLTSVNDVNKKQMFLQNNQNSEIQSEFISPRPVTRNRSESPEATQNSSCIPNIQTLAEIEQCLIHLKKNQIVLNQKLDKLLENQEFIKVHPHNVKHGETSFRNDFLDLYQKLFPIKCKQNLFDVETFLTNELTFKINLGKKIFGYSGEDVGRFMKQVLDSTFSPQFGTKISYTGKCQNKTTPSSKKVALSLLKIYNLITEMCNKKFPSCANELIRKHTDSWLRHCTQRLRIHQERQAANDELESLQLPDD